VSSNNTPQGSTSAGSAVANSQMSESANSQVSSMPSSAPLAFISQWKTDNAGASNNNQITLPLISTGNYNFEVDWGDGNTNTITAWNDPATTHTYAAPGTYTVTITGTIRSFSFNFVGDKDKLIDVIQCGPLEIEERYAFSNCANLSWTATDPLLLSSGATDLSYMWYNCTGIDPNISDWGSDISNVTIIRNMFDGTDSFTQDLSGWVLSGLTGLSSMTAVFQNCTFAGKMFSTVPSTVTGMNSCFRNSNFAGADLTGMTSWDVSGVTDMNLLAQDALNFNPDIGGWTTTALSSCPQSFQRATSFNRDLSSWDITNCTSADSMYDGATAMSNANYSALLIGWHSQIVGPSNLINTTFQCPAQYTAGAAAARSDLAATYSWTFTDGGPA
jgi:hypothetical protein